MSVKERISAQLEHFTESDLEEIARYVGFLRFRTKTQKTQIPSYDELAALYGQAASVSFHVTMPSIMKPPISVELDRTDV